MNEHLQIKVLDFNAMTSFNNFFKVDIARDVEGCHKDIDTFYYVDAVSRADWVL